MITAMHTRTRDLPCCSIVISDDPGSAHERRRSCSCTLTLLRFFGWQYYTLTYDHVFPGISRVPPHTSVAFAQNEYPSCIHNISSGMSLRENKERRRTTSAQPCLYMLIRCLNLTIIPSLLWPLANRATHRLPPASSLMSLVLSRASLSRLSRPRSAATPRCRHTLRRRHRASHSMVCRRGPRGASA